MARNNVYKITNEECINENKTSFNKIDKCTKMIAPKP